MTRYAFAQACGNVDCVLIGPLYIHHSMGVAVLFVATRTIQGEDKPMTAKYGLGRSLRAGVLLKGSDLLPSQGWLLLTTLPLLAWTDLSI